MYKYAAVILIFSFAVFVSCESGLDGNLNENMPPSTSFTVNEINLPEGERLVSQVNISWWGDDPDGYVVGFEFYIGDPTDVSDEDWEFTTRNDSTFVLPIEEGQQDADVQFTVRAIDNDDARDPDPPSLIFPITNSPPSVSFNSFETPPDTTYRISSFGFTASDPDGEENLNRVEVALNDTTSENAWKDIGLGFSLITLRIDDTVADPEAEILLGRSASPSGLILETVNLNDDNELFIRAIDNAGAISNVISYEWFVKQQTSRVLFLNDFQGSAGPSRVQLHADLLAANGITEFDYIDISDGNPTGGRRVLLSQALPDRSLSNPTTNLMLAEWDHIYWISNDLRRNIGYALEITSEFFEQGGTMFVTMPTTFIASDEPSIQFLPFERVVPRPTDNRRFEIASGSTLTPDIGIDDPPVISFRRRQQTYPPIEPFAESLPLFEADFDIFDPFTNTREPFDGSRLVGATDPDENLIFFGIDFNEFSTPDNSACIPAAEAGDGDLPCSELDRLIELLVIDLLGFQQ